MIIRTFDNETEYVVPAAEIERIELRNIKQRRST